MSAEAERPPAPSPAAGLTMVGDAAAAPVCDGDVCWVPQPDAVQGAVEQQGSGATAVT